MQNVAIFWDYENCPAPSGASGYAVVNKIRAAAQKYGMIKSLRAYMSVSEHLWAPRASVIRSELQCSGVSLVDCPHNGRKDVADKMMIVDILAHALDNSPTSTVIFLISGDRDFAYALSTLRLRCYVIALCTPNNAHASLLAQASDCLDWASIVLPGAENCPNDAAPTRLSEDSQTPRSSDKIYTPPHSRMSVDARPMLAEGEPSFNFPTSRHISRNSTSLSPFDRKADAAISWRTNQDIGSKPLSLQAPPISRRHDPFNSPPSSPSGSESIQEAVTVPNSSATSNLEPDPVTMLEKPAEPACSACLVSLDGVSTLHVQTESIPLTAAAVPMAAVDATSVSASTATEEEPTSENALPEAPSSSPSSPTTTTRTGYKLSASAPVFESHLQTINSSPPAIEPSEITVDSIPDARESPGETANPIGQQPLGPPDVGKPEEPKEPPFLVETSSHLAAEESVTPPTSTSPASALSRRRPPRHFKPLVRLLQFDRAQGIFQSSRSDMAYFLSLPEFNNPFQQAGVRRWRQYAELAEEEGIIELGWSGMHGEAEAWVALTPEWIDADAT